MLPDGVPQVGCVVEATVGILGAEGTALMVTVDAALVMQELSEVLRTNSVYVLGAIPENEAPAWYPDPILYSTPACVLKTMVPDGVPQVG